LLLTHSIGCTASFTQIAGLEAIQGPQDIVREIVKQYQLRRDAIVSGLNSIPGIQCRYPQGAFYAFPNITGLAHSSDSIADYLLEKAGVAVLPGTSFGERGEGYLRLCFANSIENIQEGIERIKIVLQRFI
jgi:aspartate/methionine/tyrosine aminotransferase